MLMSDLRRHRAVLRRPADQTLGIDAAGEMNVQVAALRHAAQECAQRGVVITQRLETRRGDDRRRSSGHNGKRATRSGRRNQDDGNNDPASQGQPPPRHCGARENLAHDPAQCKRASLRPVAQYR